VFGCYEENELIYVARTRNDFRPAVRDQLSKSFKGLEIDWPIYRKGRAAAGVGPDGQQDERLPMAQIRTVGQFQFLEWTPDNHLRHSRFVALREDKSARDVVRQWFILFPEFMFLKWTFEC
jgi:ATP-dependent DNA ligase